MELDKNKTHFSIPDFENYIIDTKKIIITNLNSNIEIKPLKSSLIKKYKLSKNGVNYYLTLFEILLMIFRENFKPN